MNLELVQVNSHTSMIKADLQRQHGGVKEDLQAQHCYYPQASEASPKTHLRMPLSVLQPVEVQ